MNDIRGNTEPYNEVDELKERQRKTKRIYYCRNLLKFFDKVNIFISIVTKNYFQPLNEMGKHFGNTSIEKESENCWRIFGADLDETLFANFLKTMKFNFYCFLKSKNNFRTIMYPAYGIYEKLLSKNNLEVEAKNKFRRTRASSLEPEVERFQYSAFSSEKDEIDYCTRKESPFDLYLSEFPSGSVQKIKTFRRSVSLPPKFDADLVSKLESKITPQNLAEASEPTNVEKV